ncbi:PAS domain-containing protein [Halorarius halobius]|uniref:PAS domain-containing protein n=1 Tax=Halorarius halobius TaxID=2962671 RepID=UPI0020CF94BE|nr:PAS domain-containing protein [Halorarius halobius]
MATDREREVLCVGAAAGGASLPTASDVAIALRERGVAARTVRTPADALDRLGRDVSRCLVTEAAFPGTEDGVALVRQARELRPELPLVLFADGDERTASEAVSAGVDEYVRRRGTDPVGAACERVTALLDDGDPTPRLLDRAVEAAPIGITVADAQAPDMPLVYVNETFEAETGYAREEALGRNCRFLQGTDTDPERVAEMRRAIDAGEATSVTLRNYRKDGEQFWNEVTLAPLRDASGTVTHYVGFQQDVTRRKEAELIIERRTENRRRLLERVDGVLEGVVAAVVAASDRETLRETACARLAASYAAAWYGPYDPADGTVRPAAGAVDLAGELSIEGADGAAPPVAEAIADGTVAVAEGAAADPHGAVAAVPVAYGGTTYGVLAVYAADSFVGATEHGLLGALGTVVATGLNALESQRTLIVDERVVVDLVVTATDAPLAALSAALSAELSLERSVTPDQFLLRARAVSPDAATDALADAPLDGTVLTERGDDCLLEVDVSPVRALEVLREHGANLRDLRADSRSLRVTFETAREGPARSVVDALAAFAAVDVEGFTHSERRPSTRGEFVDGVASTLTERQRTALLKAYAGGFFEWPHEVTGEQLAESMDIDRSTFHQHLTAAQRKLVAAFVDQ